MFVSDCQTHVAWALAIPFLSLSNHPPLGVARQSLRPPTGRIGSNPLLRSSASMLRRTIPTLMLPFKRTISTDSSYAPDFKTFSLTAVGNGEWVLNPSLVARILSPSQLQRIFRQLSAMETFWDACRKVGRGSKKLTIFDHWAVPSTPRQSCA